MHPFSQSPSLPLLPAKLVEKIQSLQFVNLKEFLPDNIYLLKRLEAFDKPSLATLPPHLRPNFCDITSVLTWSFLLCSIYHCVGIIPPSSDQVTASIHVPDHP